MIAGSRPRVGDYKDAADLATYGVSVIDLSKVKGTDSFNHTKFADNPALVKMIGQRLREDDGFASDREVTDRISLLGQ
jgi:esterase/lipase superfamily enzyme